MQKDRDVVVNRKRKHSLRVKRAETFDFFCSDVTLGDFSNCVFHTKPNAVVGERNLGKCLCEYLSEMVKLTCRIQ
jgi:hypothetical protein